MKSSTFPLNLEQYLTQEYEDASLVHVVTTKVDRHGNVSFSIQPANSGGIALDFKVKRNNLTTVLYKRRLEQDQIPSN